MAKASQTYFQEDKFQKSFYNRRSQRHWQSHCKSISTEKLSGKHSAIKDETSGLQTAKETGAAFYLVDIQNKEALENCMLKIIKRWGDIDILINNAGVSLIF